MLGTLNSIYDKVNFALYTHAKELAALQEQASTGARINRPSDGPAEAHQILGLRSQGQSLDNYVFAANELISTLEISSTIFEQMSSNLSDAEVRLTQVLSGSYTDKNRLTAAQEINDILEQLVSLANSQRMGQYLFGGSSSSAPPYVVQRSDGQIVRVDYQGSAEPRNVEVAPGVQAAAFLVGDSLFRQDSRGEPIFPASDGTGAAAGVGTSTVRGVTWLEVRDNGGFEMSIDGGASWVLVDGTNNQVVTDSLTGRVLYVDTTQIARTGKDLVIIPGTYDIFETLIWLRDMIRSGDDKALQQVQAQAGNIMGQLRQLMVSNSSSVGTKIGSLNQLAQSLTELKYDAEDETSRLQDADIAQVSMELARRQVLYEMTLSVAAKMLSMSLLDFIE
jgi:flagellar hook-associated protein 3 FlgL